MKNELLFLILKYDDEENFQKKEYLWESSIAPLVNEKFGLDGAEKCTQKEVAYEHYKKSIENHRMKIYSEQQYQKEKLKKESYCNE